MNAKAGWIFIAVGAALLCGLAGFRWLHAVGWF